MSEQPNSLHLEVEVGPGRGQRYAVGPNGARIGRDSSNDFAIRDPSLSRFHCRIYLTPDGQARIADLGSTNTTEVNRQPIQDVVLMPGDRIAIGDTVIRVLGAAPQPAAVITTDTLAAPPISAPGVPHPDAVPNLFEPSAGAGTTQKHLPKSLWLGVGAVAVLAVGAMLLKLGLFDATRRIAAPGAALTGLEIQYEKVQATAANIFRYALNLSGQTLTARIDNLDNARHVTRDKQVDPQTLGPLLQRLETSGFFALQDDYQGMAQDVLDAWDLTITVGARTKRVRVTNRVEPEAFAKVRAMVEEFGKNELGLAALSLPPERLIELARDSLLQGKKIFDEREVSFGNLHKAIKAFQAADVYLETIDPKPDFYAQVRGGQEDAKRELQLRYNDRDFRAERAVKLSDWKDAAKQLRIILEMIPEREDERNKQAQVKLLDVERHLKR